MFMLVLVLILVGLAVVMAGRVFDEKAAEANFDQVSSFLTELGIRAQKYYRTPEWLDGGGHSFTGLTTTAEGMSLLTNIPVNDHGTFSILVAGSASQVILQGIGTVDADGDGSNCTMNLVVTKNDMVITIISR